MNELTIIVAGKSCTGKSTMMIQLEKLLKENGFNVELSFDAHPDFSGENSFHFHTKVGDNFEQKIENIKANTKITLKEKQVVRDFKTEKDILKTREV